MDTIRIFFWWVLWITPPLYCTCVANMRFQFPIVSFRVTVWRRPIECFIFRGHFPQKSHIIGGSFAKIDLQPQVSCRSSPPCIIRGHAHTHSHLLVGRFGPILNGWALIIRCDDTYTHPHIHTPTHTHTQTTNTHTHTPSLSLSLSHTHTHGLSLTW